MKRQARAWGKTFEKQIPDKEYVSKYRNNL